MITRYQWGKVQLSSDGLMVARSHGAGQRRLRLKPAACGPTSALSALLYLCACGKEAAVSSGSSTGVGGAVV